MANFFLCLIASISIRFTLAQPKFELIDLNLAKWMANLPDNLPFNKIVIPATHDSAANEEFRNADPFDFIFAMRPVLSKMLGIDLNFIPNKSDLLD